MDKQMLEAKYKASQIKGRSSSCPRLGTYYVISAYKGTALKKPALKVIAKWKPPFPYVGEGLEIEIQVETLKLNCTIKQYQLINETDLVGRTIEVTFAQYFECDKRFQVNWHFVKEKTNLDKLAQQLLESDKPLSIDGIAEFDDGLDNLEAFDDGIGDFGAFDDETEY